MMKSISPRRHRKALDKELVFWSRQGIVEDQAFRTGRYEQPMLDALQRQSTGGIRRVLEVGCGPACVAQRIPGAEKWYLDPLLDEYEKLAGVSIPQGTKVVTAIEDAQLEPDFFDVVVCLNTIDHVRDPRLALASMHAATRAGGLLLLSVYVRGSAISFLRNLQERLNLSTDIAHPFTFTVGRVEDLLRSAGYSLRSIVLLEEDRIRKEHLWVCERP